MLWNSVISTDDARYLCLDIKKFYLGTPMDRFEYMKMPISIFPQATIDQYNLTKHAKNVLSTLKSAKQSTACHKQASSRTSCSVNDYARTDTTKLLTLQVCGNTIRGQPSSH